MMYTYGYCLSGGIATGKSTVCGMLQNAGFFVIDADVIAKEQFYLHADEIIAHLGNRVTTAGKLDRKKVAQLVFADKRARESLENILHPKIRETIYDLSRKFEEKKCTYFIDIPLLFESDEYDCAKKILVYAPKELQLQRLMKRNDLSEEEAMKRINSQMDIEEKKYKSDWIIDNSKDIKALEKQVGIFIDELKGKRCK